MTRLLIPTDFSPCAANAIDFAVSIASVVPLEIMLLHIHEHPGSTYTDYAGLDKEFRTTIMHQTLEKLNQLKKSIEEAESIKVSVLQYEGKITTGILKAAEETHADIIVMGTLGSGGIKERLWGSNTASVIGSSKIPVTTIPIEYNGYAPSEMLFATHQFETSEKILNPFLILAGALKARIHVAVFSSERKDTAVVFIDHARKIEEYQQKLQDIYNDKKLVAVHLSGDDFEDSIEKYINKNSIDMMAMVTYHRNFFERIFHPSITKKMSYHTQIPLMVIPVSK